MSSILKCAALGISALIAFGANAQGVEPQVKELGFTPSKILLVGNSYFYYNCGLNGYLGGMIRVNVNPKIKTRIAAIGRSNMSQQPIAEMLDNTLLDSHKAERGQLSADLLEKEVKKREKYDLVILQGSNRGKADQARDQHYVAIHAEAIRKNGGEPAMLMTWTQRKANAPEFSVVADGVTTIANQNKMMVIPVGVAFENAQKAYPDLKLIMPDNTHPTAVGSYLMASTIYASIYKRNPMEAVEFAGGCEKPVDEKIRADMHRIAWETAQAWFGWK